MPQSGQAAIEFLLITFIGVLIILGIIFQFNDAFRKFADGYFGDYLACLMETGELPILGTEYRTRTEGSDDSSWCQNNFEDFSLANGRPSKTSASDRDGDRTNSSNFRNKNPKSRSRAQSESGNNENIISKRSRSGSGSVGGVGSKRSRGRPPKIRIVIRDASESQSKEGSEEGSGSKILTGGFVKNKGQSNYAKNSRRNYRGRGGNLIYVNRSENSRDAGSNAVISSVNKKDDQREEQQQKMIPINRKISKIEGGKEENINFGNFLRYIIIAGIVVAIVIFIGGQILEITKSME